MYDSKSKNKVNTQEKTQNGIATRILSIRNSLQTASLYTYRCTNKK